MSQQPFTEVNQAQGVGFLSLNGEITSHVLQGE